MSATERPVVRSRRRRRGMSMIGVMSLVSTVAALSTMMVVSSVSANRATQARVDSSKAFYVAEGGVDFCVSQIARDYMWPARDATQFPEVLADGSFRSVWIPLGRNGGEFRARMTYQTANALPSGWAGTGFPSGWSPATALRLADRTRDDPRFDRVAIEVEARSGQARRMVRADLEFTFSAYGAAIVSDALSVPGNGSGKSFAISNQVVVIDGENQHVHGGIGANGGVYLDRSSAPLTDANVAASLGTFTGHLQANLGGTANEIPDYTNPGSQQQLFDFDRFKAAAQAGRGSYYTSIAQFVTAMNAANAAGNPLEGVVFLDMDCAAEGNNPKIETGDIPGGINVRGTLVFNFRNAPDRFYKVFGETPIHINPAPLDGTFDPTNAATFRTGYPPTISASKDPRGFDLTPWGFPGFGVNDDLPALMFNNGTVDIHHETNISGAVYGPSFIEIENQHDQRQFFNGVLIGGAGIYIKGARTGPQVFNLDTTTVDALATFDQAGRAPQITKFMVGR